MYEYITKAIKIPGNGNLKYYVQSAPQKPVDINTLADRIEKRSTVAKPDVLAVLNALKYEMTQSLAEGRTVRLGSIGSFYTRLKSNGAETQEECWKQGANLVKHITACFQRSRELSEALQPSKVGLTPSAAEEAKKPKKG